jgi:flagellum-specific peptidoglycan hydrolase FlgJ
MARIHRTDLTDKMLERLAQAKEEHKQNGGKNDTTRVIKSWNGATEQEKTLLKSIYFSDPAYYRKVENVLDKYNETFGVFCKSTLSSTIQNIKNAERNAKAKVAKGTILL